MLQELGRRIETASRDERRELLRQFAVERADTAKELQRIILAAEKQPGFDKMESEWHIAVLFLGYFGDESCCELLLDRVSIPVPRSVLRSWNTSHNFPAMEALERIGTPAIQPILRRLGMPDGNDEKTRLLCCQALHTIFGQEYGKDLAAAAVRAAIKRAQTESRRAELKLALDVIEKFPN